MGVLIFLIYRYREKLRVSKYEKNFRYVMAFVMIISEMSYFWRLVGVPSLEANPVDHLPITVCGWAIIFGSYMLVGKSQSLFDIVYFWVLGCSVFALLTPTVLTYCGPTRFRYYQFWLEHTLTYIAIFYMIFLHNMRPVFRSYIRSASALTVMVIFAAWVNSMIPGANYLYMARPESAPSVLDILPPNYALRIAVMMFAITAMFGLAYLPWYLKDKKNIITTK
jgi:hypothetical integral membrane protein (TIGR02206 family)